MSSRASIAGFVGLKVLKYYSITGFFGLVGFANQILDLLENLDGGNLEVPAKVHEHVETEPLAVTGNKAIHVPSRPIHIRRNPPNTMVPGPRSCGRATNQHRVNGDGRIRFPLFIFQIEWPVFRRSI